MRKRGEIEKDTRRKEALIVEVLLDLRDLIIKSQPKRKKVEKIVS